MGKAEEYARWVLSEGNEGKTGRLIKLAAKRFLDDLSREDIYWDDSEAVKIVNFAERYCCLWEDKWRGEKVKIMPWMAFILQQIYGWRLKEDGRRRVRKVYVQVAKKNAKTTIAGILSLYHLLADGRVQTPKIFVGANNELQSRLTVTIAGKIIEQSPFLNAMVEDEDVRIFRYKADIVEVTCNSRDGFIKPLSKETNNANSTTGGGKHGINPSLGIIDEYAMADNDALLNTLESAQAARSEPLIFCITTAGFKKDGPCFQLLRRTGVEVLDGLIDDDSYLPFIYEVDKDDDLANEDVWHKCNPNLGVSVFPDFLRSRLKAAKNEGGSKMVDVRTLNFNEWCETPEVWIPHDVWSKNTHGYSVDSLAGKKCYAAIEITSGLSLNAFALYFPNAFGEISAVRCMFWMPMDAIRSTNIKAEFEGWADRGFIEVCEGNVIDNDYIYDKIIKLFEVYNIHSVAFNVTLTNHDILQALVRAGIECNPISTSYKAQNTPVGLWEEMLTQNKVEHFNNPVLAWMNGNTQVNRNKDGDRRVQKAEGRTTGITACVNALGQYQSVKANEMDDAKIESW
jgi:phage terminase large subunit-like protein